MRNHGRFQRHHRFSRRKRVSNFLMNKKRLVQTALRSTSVISQVEPTAKREWLKDKMLVILESNRSSQRIVSGERELDEDNTQSSFWVYTGGCGILIHQRIAVEYGGIVSDVPKPDRPTTLNFDFVKGNDFRVIHADGAYLAGSGNGLTVSFYSERQALPRRVVHKLNTDMSIGDELLEQRVIRDAVIRDVNVSVAMSLQVAKNFYTSLGEIIEKFEAALKKTAPKES